ncbi:MAG TPA: hypothetical protein VGD69_14405 [Herpetosiphonaceae bacterium]
MADRLRPQEQQRHRGMMDDLLRNAAEHPVPKAAQAVRRHRDDRRRSFTSAIEQDRIVVGAGKNSGRGVGGDADRGTYRQIQVLHPLRDSGQVLTRFRERVRFPALGHARAQQCGMANRDKAGSRRNYMQEQQFVVERLSQRGSRAQHRLGYSGRIERDDNRSS